MKAFYRRWNKDTFGNVSIKIQAAEASFCTAEQAFDEDPSMVNQNTYLLAKEKLERILSQEEMLWRQKSRIKWLHDGTIIHYKDSVDTPHDGVDTMFQALSQNMKNWSTSVDTRPGQVDTRGRS
ncbi:hypothetical protein Taro_007032 [Colocasia esculenta]|uniref:Uncharacterized protein n=1 Tax=Colocasia esculenta TaxID=4460 RepID=A0A843TYM1_COLES|nr:hypothetical protein [Colocasia esculenta]